jgi:hypothetical protein
MMLPARLIRALGTLRSRVAAARTARVGYSLAGTLEARIGIAAGGRSAPLTETLSRPPRLWYLAALS